MGSKRKSSDENGDGEASPTRSGGSKQCYCNRRDWGNMLDVLTKKLDPRDLEQVQKIFQKYDMNAPESSRECKYRFQFKNEFPDILFTDTNFKVEIVLVDASNNVIRSGPMATCKIEIIVLKGDIDVDENGEWTEEQFKNLELDQTKYERSLLKGNLHTRLREGIGIISDVKFTQISRWSNKSKTFRLGVRGMAKQVQEGISNDFRVLDRRMKALQKYPAPSMHDEVYRLKGIAKDGKIHKQLVERHITTVWDFLYHCRKNGPKTLRVMFGKNEGNWKKAYEHALKSWELYMRNSFAHDQNFCELDESSSCQNVPVQHNGMITSAQELAAPIGSELGVSLGSNLIINKEVSETRSPRPKKSNFCETSSLRQNDDESISMNLSPIISLTPPMEEFNDVLIHQNCLVNHYCLVNHPAPTDQNFYELNGSSSSQNVPVQHNGMLTSVLGLAAPIGSESGISSESILILNNKVFEVTTTQIGNSFDELLEENERSCQPNNSQNYF